MTQTALPFDSTSQPSIWLVIGDKPGDNAQAKIIADGLGLPYDIRHVIPKAEYVKGKPWFTASLRHLDPQKSDKLTPPWPDLILTIGRRPAMAALWIKHQSGGRSKIVLIGRPKRWKEQFELIIVPSQYNVPPASNVLQLDFPLMQSNQHEIAIAADTRREQWAKLPRPLTALLIGGQTAPFRMDSGVADDLLRRATAAAKNGFLYITTSRRTPHEVTQFLENNLPDNARIFRWSPDAEENPYLALLGLADQFIVTGDSISMMIEVARLGRPLAIYPLPVHHPKLWTVKQRVSDWAHKEGNLIGEWLFKLGIMRYSRDLTNIHQLLVSKGAATFLTSSIPGASDRLQMNELERTVARVRALLEA